MKNTICALPAHGRLLRGARARAPGGEGRRALAHDRRVGALLSSSRPAPGFRDPPVQARRPLALLYLLVSGGKALVVDPGRDVDAHLEAARAAEAEIAGCSSRTRTPTSSPGTSASSPRELPGLREQERRRLLPAALGRLETRVGAARVQAVTTPGHTPDGMCGYVFGPESGAQPEAIFTGDTLFVGSVEPDLLEGRCRRRRSPRCCTTRGRRSSRRRGTPRASSPRTAPARSGAHLSDDELGDRGRETVEPVPAPRLQERPSPPSSRGSPRTPRYFAHNARLNRTGPRSSNGTPRCPETPPGPALADPSEFFVVDLRDAADHARAHIPNSPEYRPSRPVRDLDGDHGAVGDDDGEGRLILCGSRGELAGAPPHLHRVGYRAGIVTMESWKAAELPVAASALISPAELHAAMRAGTLDRRRCPPPERVDGVQDRQRDQPPPHAPGRALREARPVAAGRGGLQLGLPVEHGSRRACAEQPQSLQHDGRLRAWVEAGLPAIGARRRRRREAARGRSRAVRLPERISPSICTG